MEGNNNELQNCKNSYNGLSIAGFVLGIISFFLNFAGIVGILAVVFSSIGLSQLSKTQQKGKVYSILGIIFGAINIIYTVIVIISLFYMVQL